MQCDICRASKKMPDQMRSEMKNSIAAIRADLEKNVRKQIWRDRMVCEKAADENLEEFKRIAEGR